MNSTKSNTPAFELNSVDLGVLSEVLAASNDACWCMEFETPVDLTAPDAEVVRQVFENNPYWRLSNKAMEQLYLLPAGQQFNNRPVHEVFPRNARNEEFILNLISNGFEVDSAPALDKRYDGLEIYVENDVRAHIENGHLVRMFGIVRDVGKHRLKELALSAQIDNLKMAFDAVPLPVFALSHDSIVVIANTAAERFISPSSDGVSGTDFAELMHSSVGQEAASLLVRELHDIISLGAPIEQKVGDVGAPYGWLISTKGSTDAIAAIVTASMPAGPSR